MPLFKYQFYVAISFTLCLLSIMYFKAKASGPPAVGEKTAKASTPASRPAKFGGKENLSIEDFSKSLRLRSSLL
jgi:hypothetical protein